MRRALIVDDKHENLYQLRALLQGHGWTVEEAHHGAEALKQAQKAPPDIIISDLLMPVMDGYTFLRRCKGDKGLCSIPFVVYTATCTEAKDERLALDLGADAFLIKPLEPEAFVARIQEVLAGKESEILPSHNAPKGDEVEQLKECSEVLVNKLEAKVSQLEAVNRELQKEIARLQKTEEDLRQSHRDWEEIFQSTGQPTMVLDLEHGIINANNACMAVTGKSLDALVGAKCHEVFHTDGKRPQFCPMQALLESGSTDKMAFEVEALGGHFLVSCTPILDANGHIRKIIHIATDISERKRAERDMQESEEKYRLMFNNTPLGIMHFDQKGVVLEVNECFAEIMGTSRDKLVGFDMLSDLKDPHMLKALRDALDGRPGYYEGNYRSVTGRKVTMIRATYSRIVTDDGTLRGAVGIFEDITERKRAEERLRENEQKFRAIFENDHLVMLVVDPQTGAVEDASPAAASFYGYSLEELKKKNIWDINMAEPEIVLERMREAKYQLCDFFEFRHRLASGEIREVEVCSGPIGIEGRELLFSVVNDVTERRRFENELKASELRYRLVVDNSTDVIWTMDPNSGRLTFVSASVERMFGYTPEEAIALPLEEWLLPERLPDALEGMRKLVTGEQTKVVYEAQLYHKDGRILWCEMVGSLWKDDKTGENQIIGVSRDVTERKEGERKLEESEANLRSFFDAIPESLLLLKRDGTIISANMCFAKRYHTSVTSLVGKNFFEVLPPETVEKRRQHLDEVLRTAQPHDLLDERLGRLIHTRAYPVFDANGLLNRVAVYGVDITENKKMEGALRSSEERYRTIVDLSPTGIFVNVDGRYAYANHSFVNIVGASRVSDIIGKEIVTLLHPDFHDIIKKRIAFMRETGRPVPRMDQKFLRLDGSEVDVEVTAAPIEFEGQRGFLVIVNDISDRRKAEEALRESEERFRIAFLTSPDAVTLSRLTEDATGFYVDVNDGFCEQTGYTRDEVIGRSTLDIDFWVDPKDREHFLAALKDQGRVVNLETRFLLKDGRIKVGLVSARIVHLHGAPHVLAVTRDVEDWKKAEAALRASEERFRQVAEMAGEWIWEVDEHGVYQYCSSAVRQVLGYEPEAVVGKKYFGEFLESCEIEDSAIAPFAIFEERKPFRAYSRPHVRKSGEVVVLETSAVPILDSEGTFRGYRGTDKDVTDRVRSEESRELLATVVEHATEAIVVTDTQGNIKYVNPAFERTSGYTSAEALGNNPRILKSGNHEESFYRDMWKTIVGGRVWRGTLINKKKNGSLFREEASISPIRSKDGRITDYVAVKRDVTKEAELQRQLTQAQKMEAIGTLAGGIAHDFNNILQVAVGYSELVLDDEQLPRKYRPDLKKIHDSAKRGADLVQRLLTFSRKTEIEPQPLRLNRRITEFRKMLERTIPKMIDIRLLLAKDLATISADPTQMDQVLMNLGVNARDAMPEGGSLIFQTANVIIDDDYAKTLVDVKPGHYVLLTVTDTGSGMDKDTLEHIFEPFYTTKAVGEGTGLGLAVVHGIVKQHGGHIQCRSVQREGTTFKIYFPALVSDQDDEEKTTKASPRGGSETILLVDDEVFIRDLGSRILRKAGYKVITAADGEEGLNAYEPRSDEIALVLLDLMMPGMGGVQCLERLLSMNPHVKVVIASGYSAAGSTADALAAGARGFVNKPYVIRQVLEVVRQVLDTNQ